MSICVFAKPIHTAYYFDANLSSETYHRIKLLKIKFKGTKRKQTQSHYWFSIKTFDNINWAFNEQD